MREDYVPGTARCGNQYRGGSWLHGVLLGKAAGGEGDLDRQHNQRRTAVAFRQNGPLDRRSLPRAVAAARQPVSKC